MNYDVTISTRGTLTIPAAIRKTLGIVAGQKVLQRREGDTIIIELVKEPDAAISSKGKADKQK
ncbi:MAG: AbrB/MazE/SpoVT family DNA-binding domain-containing protein [Pyrinomonadaceae bacterium]|nr:AbrB/MazE/SpoVT family DNA-binding domain-containing protein [Pyrinomonadaceae bacterium]